MDRNMRYFRSSYMNSGPRSLPHMSGNKRHNGNGHHNARLSPPMQAQHLQQDRDRPMHNNNNHQDDIINYIYDAWNKVNSSDEAKYYQEIPAHQLGNFRPFNLEELWARRLVQNISRNKHRS